jgi:hypothetical protein
LVFPEAPPGKTKKAALKIAAFLLLETLIILSLRSIPLCSFGAYDLPVASRSTTPRGSWLTAFG